MLGATVIALVALPGGAALAGTPQPATMTIGRTDPLVNYLTISPGFQLVLTNAVVPAHGGVITSFSTLSLGHCPSSYIGEYDFQVLRPEGDGKYLVISETGNQTDPCDGKLHSLPVNVPVQAGDLLGVYVVHAWAGLSWGRGGGYRFSRIPKPSVGQTVSLSGADSNLVDESATLVTTADLLTKLHADAQPVGPGTSLADKVAAAQSYLAAGDVNSSCSTLAAVNHEIDAQTGKHISNKLATGLNAQTQVIQTALGCDA